MGKVQVSHQYMGGFIRTGPGVVKEQKKEVIASPLRTPEVRGREECVDFGLLQIGDGRLSAFLEGYGTDFSAPSRCSGLCRATKRAIEWMAAKRWFRVEMALFRLSSR